MQGLAVALTLLFDGCGGSAGITVFVFGYRKFDWPDVTGIGLALLAVIFAAGIVDLKACKGIPNHRPDPPQL